MITDWKSEYGCDFNAKGNSWSRSARRKGGGVSGEEVMLRGRLRIVEDGERQTRIEGQWMEGVDRMEFMGLWSYLIRKLVETSRDGG